MAVGAEAPGGWWIVLEPEVHLILDTEVTVYFEAGPEFWMDLRTALDLKNCRQGFAQEDRSGDLSPSRVPGTPETVFPRLRPFIRPRPPAKSRDRPQ